MKPHKIIILPALAAMSLSFSSCLHKDLCFDHTHRADVYVDFDWQKAPDAAPTSMLTYFFRPDGEMLEYTFSGRDGGVVGLPIGNTYCALCINGDNTYWAGMRNTDDPDRFEVFTKDAEQLESYGLHTRSLPRAIGTEDERMAMTPGMIWSHRLDNVELPADMEGEKHITFTPEETVCHYTVDVYGIKNIQYIHGASIDASISGMAEGYLHGRRTTTDVPVTMPFTLKPDEGAKSLHGEFLTFGECDTYQTSHIVTLYMYMIDGAKWYHSFDVTQQVTGAPDPKHVHIVINGLDLPQPISEGGGFVPSVNEWNDININLQM